MLAVPAEGDTVDLVLRNARPWGREDARDFAIQSGRIAAVGIGLSLRGRKEIDLRGAPIAPAFVEPHIHLDKAFTEAAGHADGLAHAAALASGATDDLDALRDRAGSALTMLAGHGVTHVRTHVNVGPERGVAPLEVILSVAEAARDAIEVEVVAFAGGSMEPGLPGWSLLSTALDLGCKAVGGGTARRARPGPLVEGLCRLAAERGAYVDLHADEHLRPACDGLEVLLQQTRRFGLGGRTVASHCCALGIVEEDKRRALIEELVEQDIGVVVLPTTNLFLQGRDELQGVGRRGLPPLWELLAAGVKVTCGADNVQDPYLPYGNMDPQLTLAFVGVAAQLSANQGREWLATAANSDAASVIGLREVGLERGCSANLVAFKSIDGVTLGTAPLSISHVIRSGRVAIDRG